jgi:hypothetical protein
VGSVPWIEEADVTVPQEDPIAELDDRFARGVAKTARHVKRFLTFYAGGLGFAVAMLMVPVVHGGGGGTPASVAGPGGAAGAAGTANPAVAAPGGRTATPAGAAAATFSSGSSFPAGDELTGGLVDGAAGAVGGSGTGTVGDRRGGALPTVPEAPSTPDFGDEEPSAPELCKVEPPSPAPAVSPEREISGAQDTVEAAVRQPLPADLGTTASPVIQQATCSTPEPPVDAPSVPLPAAPVSADATRSPLQILIDLLF